MQIHKYTNTAFDKVPERPNMWYIFEKRIFQGYQKLYTGPSVSRFGIFPLSSLSTVSSISILVLLFFLSLLFFLFLLFPLSLLFSFFFLFSFSSFLSFFSFLRRSSSYLLGFLFVGAYLGSFCGNFSDGHKEFDNTHSPEKLELNPCDRRYRGCQ